MLNTKFYEVTKTEKFLTPLCRIYIVYLSPSILNRNRVFIHLILFNWLTVIICRSIKKNKKKNTKSEVQSYLKNSDRKTANKKRRKCDKVKENNTCVLDIFSEKKSFVDESELLSNHIISRKQNVKIRKTFRIYLCQRKL